MCPGQVKTTGNARRPFSLGKPGNLTTGCGLFAKASSRKLTKQSCSATSRKCRKSGIRGRIPANRGFSGGRKKGSYGPFPTFFDRNVARHVNSAADLAALPASASLEGALTSHPSTRASVYIAYHIIHTMQATCAKVFGSSGDFGEKALRSLRKRRAGRTQTVSPVPTF